EAHAFVVCLGSDVFGTRRNADTVNGSSGDSENVCGRLDERSATEGFDQCLGGPERPDLVQRTLAASSNLDLDPGRVSRNRPEAAIRDIEIESRDCHRLTPRRERDRAQTLGSRW